MTGSLIGAIVRGEKAIFPHGDDMLHAGRPRDHLRRGEARASGRARSLSAVRVARMPRLGLDLAAALNLVGSLVKYLGARVPLPDRDRPRLRRSVLALTRPPVRSPRRPGSASSG